MASIRFSSSSSSSSSSTSLLALSFVWVLYATCASAFLEIPFTGRTDVSHAPPDRRRQVQTDTRLEGNANGYYVGFEFLVNVSVGTPPQEVSLLVSLETSEIWVIDIETCGDGPYSADIDCFFGSFDPNQSDSFERISRSSFDASLPSGSWVEGDLISETVHIGPAKLEDTTLGLVHDSSGYEAIGVLGLGYGTFTGSSSLDTLEAAGHINSTAFSMWPSSANASDGSLLLGAIDTTKFSGDLQRFQAYKYSMQYTGFYGKIGSVNGSDSADGRLEPIVDESLNPDLPFVGINPTYLLSNLPLAVAQPIWDLAGVVLDSYSYAGRAVIPCDRASSLTGRVALELGGTGGYILTANLRDLVLPADIYSYEYYASYDDDYPELDGEEMCIFGVQNIDSGSYSEESGHWVLGSYLLRNTYLVFDLANEEVGMAPVVRPSDATRANIVPFPSSAATIPKSTKVGQSWCWAYQDCEGDGVGDSDGTGYSDDRDREDWYNERDRRYRAMLTGVGVGIAAGIGSILFVGLLLGIWAFRRYRKVKKEELETGIIRHPSGVILIGRGGKPLVLKGAKELDEPESPPLPPRPAVLANSNRGSRNDSRLTTTVLPPISEDPTGIATNATAAEQARTAGAQAQMTGALHPTANDQSRLPDTNTNTNTDTNMAAPTTDTDHLPVSPISPVQPIGDVPPHAIISDPPAAAESSTQVSPGAAADVQSLTPQQGESENRNEEAGPPRIPKPSTQE
ncbi:acid protease [Sodiomyces alkalinus F11]|uniref:Acid protease n=1 Tax=Sodiomyces alkalinus (strain CBS 110278 / VKM F-3762 / F11) TaxID=1314773 RepID=A0A3N2PVS0_SODAK|nr:acid protease [Sodiomyces alkalinus F11]ROT38589.1 acid protease [Sodiomyces alkalinus F11]